MSINIHQELSQWIERAVLLHQEADKVVKMCARAALARQTSSYFQQDIFKAEETKWCDEAREKRSDFLEHLDSWKDLFRKLIAEPDDEAEAFSPARKLMEITLEVWEQLKQRGFRVPVPRKLGIRIDEEPNPMTVEEKARLLLVRNVLRALESSWDVPLEPITDLDFEKFDMVLTEHPLYVVDRLARLNGIVTIGQLLKAIEEDAPLHGCGTITFEVIYAVLQEKGYLRFA